MDKKGTGGKMDKETERLREIWRDRNSERRVRSFTLNTFAVVKEREQCCQPKTTSMAAPTWDRKRDADSMIRIASHTQLSGNHKDLMPVGTAQNKGTQNKAAALMSKYQPPFASIQPWGWRVREKRPPSGSYQIARWPLRL